MTVKDVIAKADTLRPNSISHDEKLDWLYNYEKRIYNEVYSLHSGNEQEFTDLSGFSDNTELFMPSPYSDGYALYLCSLIDYCNAEFDRYNNDSILFESVYGDYKKYYNSRYESLPQLVITG